MVCAHVCACMCVRKRERERPIDLARCKMSFQVSVGSKPCRSLNEFGISTEMYVHISVSSAEPLPDLLTAHVISFLKIFIIMLRPSILTKLNSSLFSKTCSSHVVSECCLLRCLILMSDPSTKYIQNHHFFPPRLLSPWSCPLLMSCLDITAACLMVSVLPTVCFSCGASGALNTCIR